MSIYRIIKNSTENSCDLCFLLLILGIGVGDVMRLQCADVPLCTTYTPFTTSCTLPTRNSCHILQPCWSSIKSSSIYSMTARRTNWTHYKTSFLAYTQPIFYMITPFTLYPASFDCLGPALWCMQRRHLQGAYTLRYFFPFKGKVLGSLQPVES